ncbi:hypothetical protein G6F31_018821 [Rhizopus arrhizus]|nr:hypothetical protein G6F31_018821 [Rhizopus arrhizus]
MTRAADTCTRCTDSVAFITLSAAGKNADNATTTMMGDDDGAAQDFTKEEQHRGNQAEADPRRQRQAVACTQAAQGAQQALMERLLAQVFEQALHDGRHARHQEIRQRERCQLPQGKYEQDAQNARKLLAGAGHSGRRAQSLRAS